MIRFNGQQLVEGIKLEMKRSPAGIEPKGTGQNFEALLNQKQEMTCYRHTHECFAEHYHLLCAGRNIDL